METLKELGVQNALFRILFNRKKEGENRFFNISPNVDLFGWESDLLCTDSQNLCYEFEIKTSRSDFRADMRKKKHRVLSGKKEGRKPNFFFYVVPEGEFDGVVIPEHAGLYSYNSYYCSGRGFVTEFKLIKKAPKLTEGALSIYEENKLLRAVYFKYWRGRVGGDILKKSLPKRKTQPKEKIVSKNIQKSLAV